MTSDNEHVSSDAFDVSNLLNPPISVSDSNQLHSSISHHHLHDNYLRETIGEPLSYALAYVIIYRPEDAIEFISKFLTNWSREKRIDHQSSDVVVQAGRDDERKEEQERVSNSDRHFSSSSFHQKSSHRDDENGEFSSYSEEPKQPRHIHTHDTASGLDDGEPMQSNEENKRNPFCHDGNLSSFEYFSKLREKIIKCDES